jgi:hypothetical protein
MKYANRFKGGFHPDDPRNLGFEIDGTEYCHVPAYRYLTLDCGITYPEGQQPALYEWTGHHPIFNMGIWSPIKYPPELYNSVLYRWVYRDTAMWNQWCYYRYAEQDFLNPFERGLTQPLRANAVIDEPMRGDDTVGLSSYVDQRFWPNQTGVGTTLYTFYPVEWNHDWLSPPYDSIIGAPDPPAWW